MQLEGLFDVPPHERDQLQWEVNLPLDAQSWNIGMIVGPSGCGKSTVANALFAENITGSFEWPENESVIEGFPRTMGIKDIVTILSSVGFSSPPAWMRPFRVLSTGEQFRVHIARVLCESKELAVVDEFTSVVDRTVAQIGSAAIAKTIRRRGQKFIAVSCHYDVIDWLQPDWIYEPAINTFQWRSLQRRPPIELVVRRVHHSAWELFKHHHYLTGNHNKAAKCFVGFWRERPISFISILPLPHKIKKMVRVHRLVVLPDYQGVGVGNALTSHIGSMLSALHYRYSIRASAPAVVAAALHDKNWSCTALGTHPASHGRNWDQARNMNRTLSASRLTSSFNYVGPSFADVELARQMLV